LHFSLRLAAAQFSFGGTQLLVTPAPSRRVGARSLRSKFAGKMPTLREEIESLVESWEQGFVMAFDSFFEPMLQ